VVIFNDVTKSFTIAAFTRIFQATQAAIFFKRRPSFLLCIPAPLRLFSRQVHAAEPSIDTALQLDPICFASSNGVPPSVMENSVLAFPTNAGLGRLQQASRR